MHRPSIARKLRREAAALREVASALLQSANAVERVAVRLDLPTIAERRSELSEVTADLLRRLPAQIKDAGESIEEIVNQDMTPNQDILTNSTYNKDNYS